MSDVNSPSAKYAIIENIDADTLSGQINNLIEKGWRPIGGVAVYAVQYQDRDESLCSNTYFAQALTREIPA